MSFVAPGKPIPCRLNVDPTYESKARYALRMLLLPLGLEPDFSGAGGDSDAVYYGPPKPGVSARVMLAYSPDAAACYRAGRPIDLIAASWHDAAGDDVPALFRDDSGRPDLVASAFAWLSGWHEHVSGRLDEHGRVTFAYSLNAAFGTACLPVVDAYRNLVAERLTAAGIEVRLRRWNERRWALCPTHDVDYLRKWRPGILYREFVEYLLLNRRRRDLPDRLTRAAASARQMMSGDPYVRALFQMPEEVSRRGGTATYFVKSGAGDPHDVPYRVGSSFLRQWMAGLRTAGFEVGLHPSYRTVDEAERLREEKMRLERACACRLVSVRQHYLRYDPAKTPRDHVQAGFQIDSTLGYAEHEGFRRGTCMPFQLYDLASDCALDLWEMPLAVMESALFNRRGLGLDAAVEATREVAEACRRFGGVLVGLWHTTLGDELDCSGWHEHFVRTLDEAAEHEAHIASLEGALRAWR